MNVNKFKKNFKRFKLSFDDAIKNKRIRILLIVLLGTILITGGYSYAYFTKTVEGSEVNLQVGSINYSIESLELNDNYQTTVAAGSETIVEVTINGLDDFASKYQMYYTGNNLANVVVGYSSDSDSLPSGEMSAKGSKKVTLVIQNNGSSNAMVAIGVAGGLNKYAVEDIVLKYGQYKITEEIEVFGYDVMLASVKIDGQSATSLPSSGTYKLSNYTCKNGSTLEWDTYKKAITFSAGVPKGESCSLEFTTNTNYPLLIDIAKQGDYIAYEGNNGCMKNGVPTSATIATSETTATSETIATSEAVTSGQGVNENSNSCLGYNANANSDGSKDSEYGMYGYCYEAYQRYHVSGWRIAYTNYNRAYIISAGSPECTKRKSSYGNANYITDANLDSKKYCNINYVDSCTSDIDVHAINNTDYNLITAQATNTTGGYLFASISGGTKCGVAGQKEVCGYNNDLIDNGGFYWFAAADAASTTDGVYWEPRKRIVEEISYTDAYGLRPVIRLSSNVYVTGGNGTMDDPYTITRK